MGKQKHNVQKPEGGNGGNFRCNFLVIYLVYNCQGKLNTRLQFLSELASVQAYDLRKQYYVRSRAIPRPLYRETTEMDC